MTVKETLAMLYNPKEVHLSWNGELVCFNFKNKIEVDVWGDFVVAYICSVGECVFELGIAAQSVKREATA